MTPARYSILLLYTLECVPWYAGYGPRHFHRSPHQIEQGLSLFIYQYYSVDISREDQGQKCSRAN